MTKELNYSKIIKKLEKEKQKNESSISKKNDLIKSLHIDIKKLSDNKKYLSKSILLLSSNPIKSISFIYKKESKNKYIKARFYWNKKQREVQIGSIKKTLDVIKSKHLSKKEIISLDFTKTLKVSM